MFRNFFCTLLFISFYINASDIIVRTNETGFYQINQSDLKIFGINEGNIKDNNYQLSNSRGLTRYFYPKNKLGIKKNSLIFFANKLEGKNTFQHPLDDYNGFKLNFENKLKVNNWENKNTKNIKLSKCEHIKTYSHYEENKILIRVNASQYKQSPEVWYWKKISNLDYQGIAFPVDVSEIDSSQAIQIETTFRGINVDKSVKDMPHHEILVSFNDNIIATLNWNGKTQYISEKITIPAKYIKSKDNHVKFLIPKRKVGKKTIIDLSFFDYFKLYYTIKPKFISAQHQLSSSNACILKLNKNQFSFSEDNNSFAYKFVKLNPSSKIHIGDFKNILSPKFEPIIPIQTDLAEVDYLIISHPLFIKSIQPLVKHYKGKGDNVVVVDINQIYQNYSYGVRELGSIKQLIKDTFNKGNGRLKHVLLVGDSSWDWRDKEDDHSYSKWSNNDHNYDNIPQKLYQVNIENRDFIPTGQFHSSEGHSASDNWFASIVQEKDQRIIKGKMLEDFMPDIAIGRFPASSIKEADDMVAKTLNYINNTKVGPWKSKILWITNADKKYQNDSIKVSKTVGKYGVMANNVFPKEMDGDNIKLQETLMSKINDGNLVIHFIGHGGKSLWRVGPADFDENRDLFTLDNIEELNNEGKLPFVVSMSCYSAPFDHPIADSIGEKFIRQPKTGAVAVLAASWRMTPRVAFSKHVIENIYKYPENSIGQNILKSKRRYRGKIMLEMFNLLGDPALHLAVPSLEMNAKQIDSHVDVTITTNKFTGKALVEFFDADYSMISKKEIIVTGSKFSISLTDKEVKCKSARIYAWDSHKNIDAITNLKCSD